MDKSQLELVEQTLAAAEQSIKVARNLLKNLDVRGGEKIKVTSSRDMPGVIGTFDGEYMVTKEGKRFQVPPNYASKTLLVAGDSLKKVEEDGRERFKQIEKTPRKKLWGVLAKKDGKFSVVTEEGSFKILPVSIRHFNGEVGDEATVVVPEKRKAEWAALVKIEKKKEEEEKKAEEKKDEGVKKRPAKRTKKSKPEKAKEKIEKEEEKKEETEKKEEKKEEKKAETEKIEVREEKKELEKAEEVKKEKPKPNKAEEEEKETKKEEVKEVKKEGELKEGRAVILEDEEELR